MDFNRGRERQKSGAKEDQGKARREKEYILLFSKLHQQMGERVGKQCTVKVNVTREKEEYMGMKR